MIGNSWQAGANANMTNFIVDPDTLELQITGLVPDGSNHIRQVLFDEVEARLPRDPESRVNIQLSELNPGRTASWHIHNGVVYFVLSAASSHSSMSGRASTTRQARSTPSRSEWCIGPSTRTRTYEPHWWVSGSRPPTAPISARPGNRPGHRVPPLTLPWVSSHTLSAALGSEETHRLPG